MGSYADVFRLQNLSACLLRQINLLNVHELEITDNCRLKFQLQMVNVRKERGFTIERACVLQTSTYSYQQEFPESCTLGFYPTKVRVDL